MADCKTSGNPSESPPESEPLRIDESVLGELIGVIPPDKLQSILAETESHAALLLERLRGLPEGSAESRAAAHEMRGMLANFGLTTAMEAAREIEYPDEDATGEAKPGRDARLRRLQSAVDRSLATLRTRMDG